MLHEGVLEYVGRAQSAGHIKFGAHSLEAWSVRQAILALSSGEAEFYALGKLCAHLLFVCHVLLEIGTRMRAVARTASSAAKGMAGRSGSGIVKHIERR